MALISNNLTNVGLGPGVTTNFVVQYESTLPGQANVVANANALLSVLETEFAVTTGWFNTPAGKFGSSRRQVVNLDLTSGSGGSNRGYGFPMSIDSQNTNANAANAGDVVKMIFMNEWVEVLMDLTSGKWNRGDSSGEALSQYCGIIRFPAGHYSYYGSFVNNWLQTSRPDWVGKTEPSDANPVSFGCALAFLFYLESQLGFTANQIIAAGSATLAKSYQALTGDARNPFTAFRDQLGIVYPGTATILRPNLDNPYPIGKKALWHNGFTDETQIWFLNDEWIARRATALDESGAPIFVGPPWRIVGTTDMAKDGQWVTVWHNGSTHETQFWFMKGDRIQRRATVVDETGAAIFVGPPWRITSAGDFDGDGQPDVVWHNGFTNDTQIWFMNAERIRRRATVLDETGAPIRVGPPWLIAGAADLDGDGRADILWHNSFTDDTQIWFMDGERIRHRATVVDEHGAAIRVGTPWRIVGTGDAAKNGSADIVWHNSLTDETQLWFMKAEKIQRRANVVNETGAAINVGPPWRIVGAGDLYGDAASDILWHNSLTSDIQFWFMNGPQIKGRNAVVDEHGAVIQVGDPWKIGGKTGLPGESAILWQNSQTSDLQYWFLSGPRIKGRNAVTDEHGHLIRVGDPWRIAGLSGLAAESAIAWHNTQTSDIQFWFMNGPQIKGRNGAVDESGKVIQVGAPWHIVGVTGLAGEMAVLWHNDVTNDLQFWFLSGPQIKGRNGVVDEHGAVIQVGAPWRVAGVSGLASQAAILWHNSATNDLQFWFMNGAQIKGRNAVTDENGNVIRVGDPWHIALAQSA